MNSGWKISWNHLLGWTPGWICRARWMKLIYHPGWLIECKMSASMNNRSLLSSVGWQPDKIKQNLHNGAHYPDGVGLDNKTSAKKVNLWSQCSYELGFHSRHLFQWPWLGNDNPWCPRSERTLNRADRHDGNANLIKYTNCCVAPLHFYKVWQWKFHFLLYDA